MISRYALLSAVFVLGLSAAGARADDEAEIIDAPELDMSRTAQAADGWYVRGDLGYAGWVKGGKPNYRNYQADGTVASTGSFDSARFSKPFSLGGGVGYQFNDLFRADLTADFFSGDIDGKSDVSCGGGGSGCDFSHKADYDALSILANGYVDIGTYAGFTPYVGAGVGATYLKWDDVTGSCRSGGGCADVDSISGSLPGRNDWRFTYALMAGASYAVSDRVKLDVGYRFSDIAGGDMFGYGATERGFGATGAKGSDDGFQKHEFRVGVRVSLW